MFRKLLVICTLAIASLGVNAATIDTSGLSEAQVAELKAHAAQIVANAAKAAAEPAKPAEVTAMVSLASTWGQQAAAAAEGFAKAMGIAAKELNVTINDFLKSDAGKLTAMLIIWKVAGAAFVKALYGILFVTVGLTMVRVIYTRLFTKGYEKVEYSRFGGFFKGTRMVRIPKSFHDLENDGEWLAFWVMIILTVAVMIFGGMFF